MRENRTSGSEGGEAQTNELSLPLSKSDVSVAVNTSSMYRAACPLASSDQRQIEFPQRRLEIPTQGLKKKSCSRPLRRPFPRSSFL